jgi:Uma2 family endonuclease
MATVTAPNLPELARPLLAPAPDGRVRFSREAYQRMFEAGVFGSRARVELLNGEIVMMSPIGPEHVAIISILNEFFANCLPDTLQCRIQAPVVLSDHSEPEPDLTIVQRRADNYRRGHPSLPDILLIIEVAQSSRQRDLNWKRSIYAAASISEYWVVDVDEQLLVIHRGPAGGDYQQIEPMNVGGRIAPLCAPNCELEVALLFD